MVDINITLDVLDPDTNPVKNGALGLAPAIETVTGEGKMIADEKLYPLADPFTVLTVDSDTLYRWREYKPSGDTFYAYPSSSTSGLYSDLVRVPFPIPIPDPGEIVDDIIEYYINLNGSGAQSAVDRRVTIARTDLLALDRLDRECMDSIRRGAAAASAAFADGLNQVYDWSTTSAGGAVPNDTAVQVSGGRLYYKSGGSGGAGVILPMPTAPSEIFRADGSFLWKAGGTSPLMYFGPDTGAVGHTPALNSPDAGLIGMNTLNARSGFVGANMAGYMTSFSTYGVTPTVDTTYVYSIEADDQFIFIAMRALGSDSILHTSYINRVTLAAGGKQVNNLLLCPVDSRQLTGSSFGPVVVSRSRQPGRQKTVNGIQTIGLDHSHFSSMVPGTTPADPFHVALPKDYDPRRPSPVVIFFHQSVTGFEWSPWSEPRMWPLTKAWNDAGYIVLAIRDNYDRYGNQASLDTYLAAYKHIRAKFNTGALFFFGASMGTLSMWNALSQRKWPTPAAVAGVGGAYNLRYVYDLPGYTAAVAAQYGIAGDGSDYATKTAGFDPMLTDPKLFRAPPCRFYTAADDTIQPLSGQNAFADRVRPYAPEADVVVAPSPSGHLGANQYQGADCVAFFNRYRDTAAPDVPSFRTPAAALFAEMPIPGASLPGRYYESQYVGVTLANQSRTVGTVNFHPIFIPNKVTLRELLFTIATAVSPSTCAVGLYSSDTQGNYPAALLVSTGAIDTSATGTKTTAGLSQVLEPGLYWCAFLQISGASGITPGCTAGVASIPTGGTTSAMGSNTAGLGWDLAGQSSLPASVSPAALTAGSAYRPRVQLRVV